MRTAIRLIRFRLHRLLALLGVIAGCGLGVTAVADAASPGTYTTKGAWSFVSAPNLHPPRLRSRVRTDRRKLAPGDFIVANWPNPGVPGPMIGQGGPLVLDSRLQPVWFRSSPSDVVAFDLIQQTYDRKPVLSWWEGVLAPSGAPVSGKVLVVNAHYRQIARLTGDVRDGWVISPHEVLITGHDAWVTSYKYLHNVDLSPYGGAKNGILNDSGIQEYDLRNGRLLYTWDAFNPGGKPHIPLSDSYVQPAPPSPTTPWDPYHVNSIQLVGQRRFLVSMRNTWAAYLVDRQTGKTVWTLGGKASSFRIPAPAHFEWQHQVQLNPHGLVTLFDNHCCATRGGGFLPPTGPARGLVLKLNLARHGTSLVRQYLHLPNLYAAFTGSTQFLPNGNVLVGWGSQPYFSEYSQSGKLLLDAVFPGKDLSYRALFTDDWVGMPFYPPRGAARNRGPRSVVYASWNGATRVVAWRVLAGPSKGRLKVVASQAKSGFETAIRLPRTYKLFKVQALGAGGRLLGTSAAFSARRRG